MSSIGKENYKQLKIDTKKGCKNCPFKFCVADNCKAYKKLILSNNDEIMYIIKDQYKTDNSIESNKKQPVSFNNIKFLIIGLIIGIVLAVTTTAIINYLI